MTEETARISPFRRRRVVQRHRRPASALRLAQLALATLLVVGLPAVAVGWTATTDTFDLRRFELEGSPRVPEDWLAERLASFEGSHLLALSLAEVRHRVEAHPWVGAVQIRKRLPASLEVRVEERSPAALVRRHGELGYVDASGAVYAPWDPDPTTPDLVLVSATEQDEVRRTLQFLALLEREAPRWARALSEIEEVDEQVYRLDVEGLPFPVTVSADGLAQAVADFHRWWPAIVARHGAPRSVDLRLPGRIVIQPAAGPRGEPDRLARAAAEEMR